MDQKRTGHNRRKAYIKLGQETDSVPIDQLVCNTRKSKKGIRRETCTLTKHIIEMLFDGCIPLP